MRFPEGKGLRRKAKGYAGRQRAMPEGKGLSWNAKGYAGKGLRNRILGIPNPPPPPPPKIRLWRAFPPNRDVLADILGYLGVFALETADLGFRNRPTRSDPPPLQNLSSENKGGGWIGKGGGGGVGFNCPDFRSLSANRSLLVATSESYFFKKVTFFFKIKFLHDEKIFFVRIFFLISRASIQLSNATNQSFWECL